MAVIDIPTSPSPVSTLIQNPSPCVDCLSLTEKLALKVYLLALELQLAGGTDYTDIATLRAAAACIECGLSDARIATLEIKTIIEGLELLDWQGSVTDDSIKQAVTCLRCLPKHTLKAMELLLNSGLQNVLAAPVVL